MKLVGEGSSRYEWDESWAKLEGIGTGPGWAHHGAVVTAAGSLIVSDPTKAMLVELGADGTEQNRISTNLTECHGMSLSDGSGGPALWAADIGLKPDPEQAYGSNLSGEPGVVKLSLDGKELTRLPKPEHAAYAEKRYIPTWAVESDSAHGGTGDIWVADGYGAFLVHRYDAGGNLVATLTGEEGAGYFNQPHTVWIDTRRNEPELYIADRASGRAQVYDLEGRFKRSFGEGLFRTPTGFASHDGRLFVIELHANLVIFDENDEQITMIGTNRAVTEKPGWPNCLDEAGKSARTDRLVEGLFNSPHGVAVDAEGRIYVTEWLIGGRIVRLNPVS